MRDFDDLTVSELEGSGYNEAAQNVLVGNQKIAAAHVLDRDLYYDDDEDKRIRVKAKKIAVREETT